jgi:hypothetical protein
MGFCQVRSQAIDFLTRATSIRQKFVLLSCGKPINNQTARKKPNIRNSENSHDRALESKSLVMTTVLEKLPAVKFG